MMIMIGQGHTSFFYFFFFTCNENRRKEGKPITKKGLAGVFFFLGGRGVNRGVRGAGIIKHYVCFFIQILGLQLGVGRGGGKGGEICDS